jgi:hypothetical protein
MRKVNFLTDIENRIIESVELKKQFQHKGFNFGIIKVKKELYNGAGRFYEYFGLIHIESGGTLPMYLPLNKKTIKEFQEKSIDSINSLITRIGLINFENTLNSYPVIN